MRATISLLLLLPVLAAQAQAPKAPASTDDPCINSYNAQVSRIERDYMVNRKPGATEADKKVARMVDLQIKALAGEAQKCQEDVKRGSVTPAMQQAARETPAVEKRCNEQARPRLVLLKGKYSGRHLTEAESREMGQEQEKIRAEVMGCIQRAR